MSEEHKEEEKKVGEAATTEAEDTEVKQTDTEAEAKAAARAERDKARAERAAERARKKAEEEAEPEPSPKQPRLDEIVKLIKAQVSEQAIDEAYINVMNSHMPTLIINNEHWVKTAQTLKDDESLRMNFMRNVSGVDMETHLEVVYHLISFYTQEELCVKVKTDRENASINSVTPIWETANWHEREIFDLLGIDFPGHPNMVRIMMPDDWVGHPLRKDYEPYDPEV